MVLVVRALLDRRPGPLVPQHLPPVAAALDSRLTLRVAVGSRFRVVRSPQSSWASNGPNGPGQPGAKTLLTMSCWLIALVTLLAIGVLSATDQPATWNPRNQRRCLRIRLHHSPCTLHVLVVVELLAVGAHAAGPLRR